MIKRAVVYTLGLLLVVLGFNAQTITSAVAHDAIVTGTSVCNHATGNFDVTWNIHNDYSTSTVLSNATRVASQVNGKTLAPNGQSGSTLTATESVAPGAGTLVLKVHAVWPKDNFSKDSSGSTTVGGTCQKNDVKDASASVLTTPGTCTDAGTATYTVAHAHLTSAFDTSVGTHTQVFAGDTGNPNHVFDNGSATKSITYTVEGANNNLCSVCTACHLPVKEVTQPGTLVCRGTYVGGVYADVIVKRGTDCTIVDGYVNGQVSAVGAHSVNLIATDVRGSVIADYSQNFTMAGKNSVCGADPRVGGDVVARYAHNVTLCQIQVCHKVILSHLTGRVMYRDSRSNRLVVTHNDTFVKDGSPRHHHLDAVRLYNDQFYTKVIKHNKREVIRRGLQHVGRIGGTEPCRLV